MNFHKFKISLKGHFEKGLIQIKCYKPIIMICYILFKGH